MKIALMVILAIIAVILIVSVMFQQSESNGLSALGANSDSGYGRKKSGYNEQLSKITIIAAIVFIVVNLALVVIG